MMVDIECALSGIVFKFDANLHKYNKIRPIHPYLSMPVSVAKQAFFDLTSSKRVTFNTSDIYQRLCTLRIAAFVCLRHVGALSENYTCDTVLMPTDSQDLVAIQHSIVVEAAAGLALLSRYRAGGMPLMSQLTLGCMETLVQSCIIISDDIDLTVEVISKLQVDSRVSYQTMTHAPVGLVLFTEGVQSLVSYMPDEWATALFMCYVQKSMRKNSVFLTECESTDVLLTANTTIREFEAALELPALARSSRLDRVVREAIRVAATEYAQIFAPQYKRLTEIRDQPPPKVVVRTPPPPRPPKPITRSPALQAVPKFLRKP